MKTPIKILILFAGVVIAVGAVLLYMRVIMSPPLEMARGNQYLEYMGNTIENFKDSTMSDPEQTFLRVSDLTDRFNREKKITEEEGTKSYGEFILVYAPKFVDWSKQRFRQPEWNDSQLDFIVGRVDFLKGVKGEKDATIIPEKAPETAKELEEMKEVVGKYRQARKIASSGFTSLADSKTKISQSKEFLQDPYLQNNVSLRNSLTSLPERLEAAHFASLRSQVSSMANYQSMNRNSYNNLSDRVLKSIKEYQANAGNVYGHSSNVSELMSQASRHQAAAEDYFDRRDYENRIGQSL